MKFTGRYKEDHLGRRWKVYKDKWGYDRTKEKFPMEMIWPFRQFAAFAMYRQMIKVCDPDEIAELRNLIGRYGFTHGVVHFNGNLRSKRARESVEAQNALRDIADGLQPGQSHEEYVKGVKDQWNLEAERVRKRQLLKEYKQELKDQQELDRISEQDLRDAIERIKKGRP